MFINVLMTDGDKPRDVQEFSTLSKAQAAALRTGGRAYTVPPGVPWSDIRIRAGAVVIDATERLAREAARRTNRGWDNDRLAVLLKKLGATDQDIEDARR